VRLITLAMATEVAVERKAVWERLVDPEEATRLHPGVDRPPQPEGGWPRPGGRLRLTTLVRDLPVELRETVLEAEPGRSLRCRVRLGLHRFEATWTLHAEAPGRTRLGLRIVTANEVPLVGGALDRFSVRRLAQEMAASWLCALRERCEEADATPASPRPARAETLELP